MPNSTTILNGSKQMVSCMNKETAVRAVLFDYDGTLRDTKHVILGALKAALEHHGATMPSTEELTPHLHHSSFVRQAFLPDVSAEEFEKVYYQTKDILSEDVTLFEGTAEMLKNVRANGYAVGLVTAAKKSMLQFEQLGLQDSVFDVIIGAEDLTEHKPHPQGILMAVKTLGVSLRETVYVGDMPTDYAAAVAAGVEFVGAAYGFFDEKTLRAEGAEHIIHTPRELPALLANIRS